MFVVLVLAVVVVVSAQHQQTWQFVSSNISYSEDVSATKPDVVVFFAGYNCLLQDTQVWAGNVVASRMNARHVFATAGPRTAAYVDRELNTSGLALRIQQLASPSSRVTVLAHSSGAFPAFAFLKQLSPSLRNVHLFCLDSGIFGATDSMLRRLAGVVPVVARDTKTGLQSRLTSSMQELAARKDAVTGRKFTSPVFVCKVQTKCAGPKGYNCMHDAVINRTPFNSSAFDLHADYNLYNNLQSVQTDYLDSYYQRPLPVSEVPSII